jgi:hypothetical protein
MFVGVTFQATTFTESEGGPNPYSIGTAKRKIFAWCLAQTDGFTKQEFYDYVLEALSNGEIVSKMKTPETTAGAWFSELKNKAKAFEIIEA